MGTPFVLRNAKVSIDGVDLSSLIREVQVVQTAADVDVTAMGSGGRGHLAGIRDDSFTFTAYSDFTASQLHQTINTKWQSGGTFWVKVMPGLNGSTIGTANPMFQGYCPALSYTPLGGAVGDASMTPLNFPANGTITTSSTIDTFP